MSFTVITEPFKQLKRKSSLHIVKSSLSFLLHCSVFNTERREILLRGSKHTRLESETTAIRKEWGILHLRSFSLAYVGENFASYSGRRLVGGCDLQNAASIAQPFGHNSVENLTHFELFGRHLSTRSWFPVFNAVYRHAENDANIAELCILLGSWERNRKRKTQNFRCLQTSPII